MDAFMSQLIVRTGIDPCSVILRNGAQAFSMPHSHRGIKSLGSHWDLTSGPTGLRHLRRGQRYVNSRNMPKLEAQSQLWQSTDGSKTLWRSGGLRFSMIFFIFNLEKRITKNDLIRYTRYTPDV